MTSPVRHGWHRSIGPDPKPAPKVRDKSVYEQFHAQENLRCLLCGDSNVEAAHLLGGKNREDVLAGLIPLCTNDHRAWHGQAYREEYGGKRITPEMVRRRVAEWLRLSADAESARFYLTAKLGPEGSLAYRERLLNA